MSAVVTAVVALAGSLGGLSVVEVMMITGTAFGGAVTFFSKVVE